LAALFFALGMAPQGAGAADTRTISLHNIHTHENLTITFKKNGRFDDEALKKLNAFMRDWRKDEEVRMDPQLFDMLWEVHAEVKASGPIHVVCGYRSPATNSMLRSRSGGVAKTSLHMQGKAVDFSIPSAEVADVRAAALRIQGGGVGYYPTSGIPFVHMDVGSVRHWPRMTRDQLAKVFPNGRTLHVPTDGNPLPGYELAQADAERGVSRRPAEQRPQRSLLAALFSGAQQDAEETADNTATASTPTRPPAVSAARRLAPGTPIAAPVTETAAVAIPLPPVRPTFQIASATEQRVPAPAPKPIFQIASASEQRVPAPAPRAVNLASLSPNQIISERGYWQGLPDSVPEISASRRAGSQTASADPDSTASLSKFVRNDRVPSEVALAYAAQSEPAGTFSQTTGSASAVVTTRGSASLAAKASELQQPASRVRAVNAAERLNDPWLRGVVMAPSLQNSLTTTLFGAPDFRTLRPFMQKPASTVMMTFNTDPYLGMTTDAFTGSAVVFQATVTFGMRTAMLQQ
jgi:uncharacterized protein YcbK (DUF882 family)